MSSISKNSFKWASCFNQNNPTSFECGWIAVGKQQWGSTSNLAESASVTFTYPIAFASAVYSCCIQQKTANNNGEYINAGYLTSYSKSSCILQNWAYANTAYWLLFIGKQQWGLFNSTSTTGTINLPLTMPSADYKPMITMLNSCASCGVKNVTTSSFYYFTRDENGTTKRPAYWLIVGNQQWGYISNESKNNPVTLPISLSHSNYHTWVCCTYTGASGNGWNYAHSRTPTGFKCVTTSGSNHAWLALAYTAQQWGQKASSGSTTSVTYPIAMSSCFTVVGNMCTNGINGYEHNVYPYTISTSTFTMYTRNSDSKAFSWLAVGKQQWGSIYIPSDTRKQISFPITYNSIPYAIALSNQGEKNTEYASAYSDLTQSSVYLADNKDTVHFIVLGT